MKALKHVQRLAQSCGVDIRRYNYYTSEYVKLKTELSRRNIPIVLDVGANDGGFGAELFGAGYQGKIVSFEPLPDAWAKLRKRAKGFSPRWQVGPQIAVSDSIGSGWLNQSYNSVSSSIMTIDLFHTEAASESATKQIIPVSTSTLDSIVDELEIDVGQDLFLKLDVQGAEDLVLKGALNLLKKRIVGVKIELSLRALYGDQLLWVEQHKRLEDLGFTIWDLDPGIRDERTKQLLQVDGLYFRAK